LASTFGVWRQSLLAGFLGAFASEFWFLSFSMTTATNVRTLALIEVILAQVVSVLVMGQSTSRRQLIGMGIVVAGVAALLRLDLG
jgi:drug/metabolite transporter (DMT)-like permease